MVPADNDHVGNSIYRLKPFSWDDAGFYRKLLLQLRYGAGLHNRALLANVLAQSIRHEVDLPPISPNTPNQRDQRIASLRTDGFCHLGSIFAPEQVAGIRDTLGACPLVGGRASGGTGRTFSRSTAPIDENIGTIDEATGLSSCPELIEIANHPDILSVVEGFLGAPPTVQYYAAWWSFAGRGGAQEAQFFHYDRNCFRFVKLFVYLTHVGIGAGPHVYVRGSAEIQDWMRRLEDAKLHDPENARRFLDMINATRKTDDDVIDFFGRDRLETFTGDAGEAFLVDTSGIHKGQFPETDDRLVFQATYALLPTLKEEARQVVHADLAGACIERYGEKIDRRYFDYVNRIAVAERPS
jgi:hypothetical protein